MVLGKSFTWESILKFLIQVTLGALGIGVAFGIASVIWIRYIFNDTVIEITLTLAVSYIAYFMFYVSGFPSSHPQRVKRFAVARTRIVIVSLKACDTSIVVGDCRDGVLFYSYHEYTKKLEQLYCDPELRLVSDCHLINADTAIISDRKGSIAVMTSCGVAEEDIVSPESNLALSCSYYLGDIAVSLKKELKLIQVVLKSLQSPSALINVLLR